MVLEEAWGGSPDRILDAVCRGAQESWRRKVARLREKGPRRQAICRIVSNFKDEEK